MRREARGMRCDMRQTVDMTSQGDMFWKSHKGSAAWPARTSAVHASETSCASPRPAADPFTSQEPRARRRYTGGARRGHTWPRWRWGPWMRCSFSPGQARRAREGGGEGKAEEAVCCYTTCTVPARRSVVGTVCPSGHGELATSVAETDAMGHGLSVRIGQRAVERPDGLWMQSAGGAPAALILGLGMHG